MTGDLQLPTEPVEIAAGRLQLRPWVPHLAARALDALSDPEIVRWSIQPGPADLAAAAEWIAGQQAAWQAGTRFCFAVHDAISGDLVGDVMLAHIDTVLATGMIGYWTAPWARGHGVAPDAVAAISRWAFDAVGLHRLELSHAVENIASCRVAVKTGFTAEGIMRSALPRPIGGWWDTELHSMINPAHRTSTD